MARELTHAACGKPLSQCRCLVHVEAVYSPDDRGWYAEVWRGDGSTAHTTALHPSREAAMAAGRTYLA